MGFGDCVGEYGPKNELATHRSMASNSTARPVTLRFAWWNVQSFAHFEETRVGRARWPASEDEYDVKCSRVEAVLREIDAVFGSVDLIGLGEITSSAALQLRDRAFPGYEVFSLDLLPEPDFHVAFIYRASGEFGDRPPIVVPNMPPATRPMAVVDFACAAHRIRFIACHWTAPFEPERSRVLHSMTAKHLEMEIYDYLHEAEPARSRHVVVLGDFNTEPYGVIEQWLEAARSRVRARSSEHYTDRYLRRVRLYNCAWRLLGETLPHGLESLGRVSAAGTYCRSRGKTWHTFDQVLVDSSLLSAELPFLAENRLQRVVSRSLVDDNGCAIPFDWNSGNPVGVSDHLPLVGELLYAKE